MKILFCLIFFLKCCVQQPLNIFDFMRQAQRNMMQNSLQQQGSIKRLRGISRQIITNPDGSTTTITKEFGNDNDDSQKQMNITDSPFKQMLDSPFRQMSMVSSPIKIIRINPASENKGLDNFGSVLGSMLGQVTKQLDKELDKEIDKELNKKKDKQKKNKNKKKKQDEFIKDEKQTKQEIDKKTYKKLNEMGQSDFHDDYHLEKSIFDQKIQNQDADKKIDTKIDKKNDNKDYKKDDDKLLIQKENDQKENDQNNKNIQTSSMDGYYQKSKIPLAIIFIVIFVFQIVGFIKNKQQNHSLRQDLKYISINKSE